MTYIPPSRMQDSHLGQLNLQAEKDFPRALFVCSGGMLRSATCAQVMSHYGWNTRTVGTYSVAIQQVTIPVLNWADVIFCMESRHAEEIEDMFPDVYDQIKFKIRIMSLPDIYNFRNPKLIRLILNYFNIEETDEGILNLFEKPKEQAKEMLNKLIIEEKP